jgi:hypothetical protein
VFTRDVNEAWLGDALEIDAIRLRLHPRELQRYYESRVPPKEET